MCDAMWPVGETIRRIMGTEDETRASEMLDLRVETGVGLASIEESDRVLVGESDVDESATQECDTTEDEQAHIRCPG
jgi:hypothetical protein